MKKYQASKSVAVVRAARQEYQNLLTRQSKERACGLLEWERVAIKHIGITHSMKDLVALFRASPWSASNDEARVRIAKKLANLCDTLDKVRAAVKKTGRYGALISKWKLLSFSLLREAKSKEDLHQVIKVSPPYRYGLDWEPAREAFEQLLNLCASEEEVEGLREKYDRTAMYEYSWSGQKLVARRLDQLYEKEHGKPRPKPQYISIM